LKKKGGKKPVSNCVNLPNRKARAVGSKKKSGGEKTWKGEKGGKWERGTSTDGLTRDLQGGL